MSAITINGEPVVSCGITFTRWGSWTADVIMASVVDLPDAVTLAAGNLTVHGTVVRKGSFAGSRSVRVVAGAGGLRLPLPSRGYSHAAGVKASSVLGDIARESGERIAVATDRSLGAHYIREGGVPAERLLGVLTDGEWWIDNDGIVQTGPRATGPVVSPFTVIAWSGAKGQFEIATEALAEWQPGRTFTAPTVPGEQAISSVTIESDNDGKLRLFVLNGEGERLRESFRAMVQAESPSMLFMAVWEYTIVSGDSDTVDVRSSDARMPPITDCPMMPGLMGEKVTPTPGAKCRVRFVNGDRSRPECIGIVGTPVKVEIAGPIPTQAAARFGDAVSGVAVTSGSTKVFIGG